MDREQLVITGVGAVCAAGVGREALFQAVIGGMPSFTSRTFPRRPGLPDVPPVYGAHVGDLDLRPLLGRKGVRTLNRESRLFMSAGVLACREAGLERDLTSGDACGVAAGTTLSGLDAYVELFTQGLSAGVDRVDPALGPQTGYNAPASQLSILLGARGPNLTIASGYASGIDAVVYGAHFIEEGRADIVLAGGVETLSSFAVYAEHLADPQFGRPHTPRPFDAQRRRSVPGEGAVVLVVERKGSANDREAPVLCAIRGAGSAHGPSNGRAGSETAARLAIEHALGQSGFEPDDVDAVVASANGSWDLDETEATALYGIFGGGVDVFAVKGAVGESRGAGGAMQVAVGVLALHEQTVPGTCGYVERDRSLPPLRIASRCVNRPLRTVLVHSLDPGGYSTALVLQSTLS